jgi:hypothetical protein
MFMAALALQPTKELRSGYVVSLYYCIHLRTLPLPSLHTSHSTWPVVAAGRICLVHLDDGEVPGQRVLAALLWRLLGIGQRPRLARSAPEVPPLHSTAALRSATDSHPACTWNLERRHLVLVFSLQMLPAWL